MVTETTTTTTIAAEVKRLRRATNTLLTSANTFSDRNTMDAYTFILAALGQVALGHTFNHLWDVEDSRHGLPTEMILRGLTEALVTTGFIAKRFHIDLGVYREVGDDFEGGLPTPVVLAAVAGLIPGAYKKHMANPINKEPLATALQALDFTLLQSALHYGIPLDAIADEVVVASRDRHSFWYILGEKL